MARDNLLMVRGTAAVCVVLNHSTGYPSAYIAVWLFFMLSSFLLTKGFLDRRFGSAAEFYKSRAMRLLPTLFFVQMLLMALAGAGWPGLKLNLPRELGVLVSLTYNVPAIQSINSVVWSVILEIHFISLLPFLIHVATPRRLLMAIISWTAIVLGLAASSVSIWGDGWYGSHIYNAGFFAAGMLAAMSPKRPSSLAIPVALGAWLACELIGNSFGFEVGLRYGPLLMVPTFYILLVGVDTSYQRPLPRTYRELLSINGLEALGAISYTLYLTHRFVVLNLMHNYLGDGFIAMIFSLLIAFAVAVIVYAEVESRFRNMRTHSVVIASSKAA